MIWVGFGVGILILVVVFILIRFLSIRLPLKPFFTATSLIMFVLCVTFTGSGFHELGEANAISLTLIEGLPTIDLLGIYPYFETLIPQAILLVIAAATIVYQIFRWKKNRTVKKEGGPDSEKSGS
jgi:high-affinity iron transporter